MRVQVVPDDDQGCLEPLMRGVGQLDVVGLGEALRSPLRPRCTRVRNISRPRSCGRTQTRPAIEIRPEPLPDTATVGVSPRRAQVRAIGGRMF
jgi:hypothetical protein